MPTQLGVGLIGLDHWYAAFATLDEVANHPGLHLVAVADSSAKRLSEIARKYHPDYTTSNPTRVIADPDISLISSQVNTRDNVPIVRRALRAGKHVACVKPLAMTLRQADSLIALAERQGLLLWSFDLLGRARAAALKPLIQRGAIGQPISFFQTMWAGLPMPWHDRTGPSWWLDPKLVPFGAWADHAIYTIDMLRFLFDAEVASISAHMANKRYPKLKLEDYGVAALHLTNGLLALIEQTWTGGPYYPHFTKIIGTHGVIHLDQAINRGAPVLITSERTKPIKVPPRRGGALARLFSLIRAGRASPSPARDSRANLAVALAAYQSSRTGRVVSP